MLNNINNNNTDVNISSQLVKQNSQNTILGSNSIGAANTKDAENIDNNFYIDSSDISNTAMKMFEKEQDVSNFTKLATSDPENTSHNDMVKQLFSEGVTDPFEDSALSELTNNQSLLDDLGL